MSDAFAPVERQQSLKARQISIDTPPAPAKPMAPVEPKPYVAEPKPQIVSEVKVTTTVAAEPVKAVGSQPQYDLNALKNNPEFQRLERILEERNGKRTPVVEEPDVQQPAITTVAQSVPAIQEPELTVVVKDTAKEEKPHIPHYRIVGEAFNAYVIVEVGEKMLIIDKHAAHERIIFEELKANMYSSDVPSQLLMIPVDIMLMSDEVSALEEYRPELEAVGFEFSSQRNSVSVYSLPMGIEPDAVVDMFTVIADRIKNGTGSVDITRNIVFEKALYQASCKAAIKAGREYPAEHQKWVVDKLMQIPDITFCPHGRPVAMELSKKNIDRQFERT
jgi:DNA mismatch repair protein MutL